MLHHKELEEEAKLDASKRIDASIYRLSKLAGINGPNPIKCGCAIVSSATAIHDGTTEGPTQEANTHIRFCKVHQQAYEMFGILKEIEYRKDELCSSCEWPREMGHHKFCKLNSVLKDALRY